jgi:hypothetical protein
MFQVQCPFGVSPQKKPNGGLKGENHPTERRNVGERSDYAEYMSTPVFDFTHHLHRTTLLRRNNVFVFSNVCLFEGSPDSTKRHKLHFM